MRDKKERSVTSQIASFVTETSYQDLPDKVIQDTIRLIFDSIGCAFGGLTMGVSRKIIQAVEDLGGRAESTVIGGDVKTTCSNAAYANAKLANLMDMDDFYWGGGHHSPVVIYSALAVGEREKASGKDIITAVALGFEVGARCSLVMTPPAFQMVEGKLIRPEVIGFGHGIFGGAAAAGKLLRFDTDKMKDALGIAGIHAPAPFAKIGLGDISPSKYQLDWTAKGAVFASLLAQKGMKGPPDILDSESFAKAMGVRTYLPNVMVKDIGKRWAITETGIKAYPSCRHFHTALDLFEKIVKKQDMTLREIEAVTVKGSKAITLPHISNPEPEDEFKCQYSLPYNIAMIAQRVVPGPEWLAPERVNDPKTREFAKKVRIEEYPKAAEMVIRALPFRTKKLPTIVEIEARGKKFIARGEVAKGEGWSVKDRMTEEELTNKFRANVSPSQGHERVERLIETIFQLQDLERVEELTRLLGGRDNPPKVGGG